jgi:hypothetical protein
LIQFGLVQSGTDAPPPNPPPTVVAGTGTLTLQWTIDSQVSPGSCDIGGATTLHIQLTTTAGIFAGEFVADCAQFATTIPSLAADGYTATVELEDPSGAPRTTSIQIDPFTILVDSTLIVDIDFPPDSFSR